MKEKITVAVDGFGVYKGHRREGRVVALRSAEALVAIPFFDPDEVKLVRPRVREHVEAFRLTDGIGEFDCEIFVGLDDGTHDLVHSGFRLAPADLDRLRAALTA